MTSAILTTLTGLTIMLSAWGTNSPDTADFVLVKESNGIALYERWFSIRPNEPVREVKATFTIKAPAQAAIALIRDESRGTEWNKNTLVYKVMNRDDNIWLGYIEYDLPWPVSNRDCVLHYKRIRSSEYLRVEFRGIDHPLFPIRKKVERIPEISGKWIFRERGGSIDVEYYVTTKPNPTLPSWVTDPIIRNNLLETLDGFRELLEAQPSTGMR